VVDQVIPIGACIGRKGEHPIAKRQPSVAACQTVGIGKENGIRRGEYLPFCFNARLGKYPDLARRAHSQDVGLIDKGAISSGGENHGHVSVLYARNRLQNLTAALVWVQRPRGQQERSWCNRE
jgi:hypothetical protein